MFEKSSSKASLVGASDGETFAVRRLPSGRDRLSSGLKGFAPNMSRLLSLPFLRSPGLDLALLPVLLSRLLLPPEDPRRVFGETFRWLLLDLGLFFRIPPAVLTA